MSTPLFFFSSDSLGGFFYLNSILKCCVAA